MWKQICAQTSTVERGMPRIRFSESESSNTSRMTFFARVVMLLQWVEPEIAWRVLLLKAQRAQDCFASWHYFGQAFVAGRRQWVAAFRADPFGKAFDDGALAGWLNKRGAWRNLPWPGLGAFSPEPAVAAARGPRELKPMA